MHIMSNDSELIHLTIVLFCKNLKKLFTVFAIKHTCFVYAQNFNSQIHQMTHKKHWLLHEDIASTKKQQDIYIWRIELVTLWKCLEGKLFVLRI
jgi:hypothetical protein